MAKYPTAWKVGILGGGQLARMLSESAARLGLKPHVYSASPSDPAAQVTPNWYQGELHDSKRLKGFVDSVDVCTFESEFVPAQSLAKFSKKLHPMPSVMGRLQDRKTQKQLLDDMKIPTAPWAVVETPETLETLRARWQTPIVCKKRYGGYDGYGTFVLKTPRQILDFQKNTFEPDLFIAEQFIPFRRECAVMIGRSADKTFTTFPLVESFQENSRCLWVKGPIKNKSFETLRPRLKKLLKTIDYVGVMGVEFFEKNNQFVVNELAPRVHNSGHYTMNGEGPSQFDIHWLCLLGHKLPRTIAQGPGFAMMNLLGTSPKRPLFSTEDNVHLHWYGKEESRVGRKMGHLNAVGKTPADALKKVIAGEKRFQI